MSGAPWLLFAQTPAPALWENTKSYNELCLQDLNPHISLITFIGAAHKSRVLHSILNPGGPQPLPHGQTYLWRGPRSDFGHSVLIADCELAHHQTASEYGPVFPIGHAGRIEIEGSRPEIFRPRELAASVCSRVLGPLSNIVVVFASDFGGILGAANFITEMISCHAPYDLLCEFKPRIVVVSSTRLQQQDEAATEMTINQLVKDRLTKLLKNNDWNLAENLMSTCFDSIQLIQVDDRATLKEHGIKVEKRLFMIDSRARKIRAYNRVLFSFSHFQGFTKSSVKHFCTSSDPAFSFVRASRPYGFSTNQLAFHLEDVFKKLPCEVWLWQFIIPVLSSALLLASYPPGSHLFSPSLLFSSLYREPITSAIQSYARLMTVQLDFISRLEEAFVNRFRELEMKKSSSPKSIHLEQLSHATKDFEKLQSDSSCLCCFMDSPGNVLDCGHALCNTCMRIFGHRALTSRYAYHMPHCVLCKKQLLLERKFIQLPPTAGIRILSLDGGGVRAFVTMTVLEYVEDKLSFLNCAPWDFFDLVVGTSAGGLTAIGIFLMKWNATECRQKFDYLVRETFQPQQKLPSILEFAKAFTFMCLDKSKYDSRAIKDAFHTVPYMFNPLHSDTKVAVVAAPLNNDKTIVLCNYNGQGRPADLGYQVGYQVRDTHNVTGMRKVTVVEAAAATASAPLYFQAVKLGADTFAQDGALHYNNPEPIAWWEYPYIWPEKPEYPDLMFSIGTGFAAESQGYSAFISKTIRGLRNMLDRQLSGWRQSIETRNWLPQQARYLYHRVDLKLDSREPAIDDLSAIPALRKQTEDMLSSQEHVVRPFIDHWLASLFFVELDTLVEESEYYTGTAIIQVRPIIPNKRHKDLCLHLKSYQAYFIVNSVPETDLNRTGDLSFRYPVKFHISRLDERLHISLAFKKHGTVYPISSMPRSINEMMEVQGFDCKFGRSDHSMRGQRVLRTRPAENA